VAMGGAGSLETGRGGGFRERGARRSRERGVGMGSRRNTAPKGATGADIQRHLDSGLRSIGPASLSVGGRREGLGVGGTLGGVLTGGERRRAGQEETGGGWGDRAGMDGGKTDRVERKLERVGGLLSFF